jgi:hypothetical protein
MPTVNCLKQISRKQSYLLQLPKRINPWELNLTKETKYLYNETCKILIKEIE